MIVKSVFINYNLKMSLPTFFNCIRGNTDKSFTLVFVNNHQIIDITFKKSDNSDIIDETLYFFENPDKKDEIVFESTRNTIKIHFNYGLIENIIGKSQYAQLTPEDFKIIIKQLKEIKNKT